MKLVTIQYPDSTDISALAIGAKPIEVRVSGGTVSITSGEVMAKTELKEPDVAAPVLVPHTHPVAGTTGPAN